MSQTPEFHSAYLADAAALMQQKRKGLSYYGELEICGGIDKHAITNEEGLQVRFAKRKGFGGVALEATLLDSGDRRLLIRDLNSKRHGEVLVSARCEGERISAADFVDDVDWLCRNLVTLETQQTADERKACASRFRDRWLRTR